MIAKITGTVSDLLATSVIVDVAGVGYELFVTPTTHGELVVGKPAELYVAENIKEDAHELYGFAVLEERTMYYQLTSVSGVGPKAALAILTKHTSAEITEAILGVNISLFSNVSGIGKKTASRIILDLKGKLVEPPAEHVATDDPAYQALQSLGYKAHDAKKALAEIPSDLPTQERIKQALKELK